MQQNAAREELCKNVQAVLQCDERWQRRLKGQETLYTDNVEVVDSGDHQSSDPYYRIIEWWELFKDFM